MPVSGIFFDQSHLPLNVTLQKKMTGYAVLLPELLVHMQLKHIIQAMSTSPVQWNLW